MDSRIDFLRDVLWCDACRRAAMENERRIEQVLDDACATGAMRNEVRVVLIYRVGGAFGVRLV